MTNDIPDFEGFEEMLSEISGGKPIVNLEFRNTFNCNMAGEHLPKDCSFAQHVAAVAVQIRERIEEMNEASAAASEDGEKLVVPYAVFEIHFTSEGMILIPSDYIQEWATHIVEEDGLDREYVQRVFNAAMNRLACVNTMAYVNKEVPGSFDIVNIGRN